MSDFHDARDTWDRRYERAQGLLFGDAPNRWLAEQSRWLPAGGRVLCVADGEGRNSVHLASEGFDVTAFDISPVAVEKARALAASRGAAPDLRVADVTDWPFDPDSYDAIVAVFIQFAGPQLRERLFEGFRRALRPRGVLLIEGFGLRQLHYRSGGPGIAEHLYRAARLDASFRGWEILASRDADVLLDEGRGHAGLAHSVAAVYRKPAPDDPAVRG